MRLFLLLALCASAGWAGPRLDTVLYGVSYYHEYMPYDRLEKDVELMKKAGLTVVRAGESTWSSWEPREGEFQYDWMQRVLDRLHEAGIQVILGTPTYSIPPWLYRKHPDILVTRFGTAPPLSDPYHQSYPSFVPPGAYGPRQNIDITHPAYLKHSEQIIRAVVGRFKDHPAVIGWQVDNETHPIGLPLPQLHKRFVERLKARYETPEPLNRRWGLAYWGQLVSNWDDFPPRDGILNPGYKLEWERFQQDIVTEFLGWQANIVREYKRPDQFVTHNFVGGIRTNLDQWGIAGKVDIAAVNPYHAVQDRLDAREIWLSGDLCRSLKRDNCLIAETNAQTIGWDSRAQYPPYPGQLRLSAYAHVAAGANMVAYWHWHSLHYGQETYWRGVLSHDLEPNRIYGEVSKIGAELKALGPQLANLKKSNSVAILYSSDSVHALNYMPVSDRVNYMTVLNQMYDALYRLNVEPDFVTPGDMAGLSRYRVVLVPPLYSASDKVLENLARYVQGGGQVVMSFKSGFTDEHSTVRWQMAPGPLRAAAGFRYQEFSSLPSAIRLTPDPYKLGERNTASVWAEFLIPETAETVASYDHPHWKYPAITRNRHGKGTLTYQGTFLSGELQREVIREALERANLTGPDQKLPDAVKVRHGRNGQGRLLHYYLNFSGAQQSFPYPYKEASDLLTKRAVRSGEKVTLEPWDLAILAER